MTALPAGNIWVEIQVRLDQLRAQLALAERAVDSSAARMGKSTDERGPFASLTNRFARGFFGVQGIRAGIEAVGAVVNASQRDWDGLRSSVLAMSNALSFGLAGSLQNVIDDLTGYTDELKASERAMANWIHAQQALTNALDVRRKAEAELRVLEAKTPQERVRARLGGAAKEIQADLLEMERQGVPTSVITEISRARRRAAEIEAVRSEFRGISASQVENLLKQIRDGTMGAPL